MKCVGWVPADTLVKYHAIRSNMLRVRPNAFPFASRPQRTKAKKIIETPPMGPVYSKPVCERGIISSKICIDQECVDCLVSASFLLGSKCFKLAFAFEFLTLKFVLLGQSYGILTFRNACGCLFFLVHLVDASLHIGS